MRRVVGVAAAALIAVPLTSAGSATATASSLGRAAGPLGVPEVQATLVQLIETSRFRPSSPDPAGIAYLPATDTFLISDSEVDEVPIYEGTNLYTGTRTGRGVGVGTTSAFTKEPTGLSLDRVTRTLFVSDDLKHRIHMVRPGRDRRYATADDRTTSFSTQAFGSLDPEDLAYDPATGHLFVCDGAGEEVYDVNPVDGAFGDGDDVVTHFDTARYGAGDGEGLTIDHARGLLLYLDPHSKKIYELTKGGALVGTVDLSTIRTRNKLLSGITLAPTSDPGDPPTSLSYWVDDRQDDNDHAPHENDGKLYELSAPGAGTLPLRDTIAPQTWIAAGARRVSRSRRATFWFRSTERRSRFRCKLDRGAWDRCRSPRTYRNIAPGAHRFRVAAGDAAGNVDATPAVHVWRVVRRR